MDPRLHLFFFLAFLFCTSAASPVQNNRPRQVANSTVASSTTVLSTATPTLNGTCPITYAPTPIPIATRTWPQEVICELASRSAEDAYYYIADQCLAGYCSSSLSSAISSFDESDETVMLTQTTVRVDRALYGTGSQSTVVTELLYTTQTVTYEGPAVWVVKRSNPCCGQCILSARTVQLYYWPNQATATPTVTGLPADVSAIVTAIPKHGSGSYVDENGFTFISPSLYIGFSSIYGTDQCGTVGDVLTSTTIGFDPGELSTIGESTVISTCAFTMTDRTLNNDVTWTMYSTATNVLHVPDVAQNCSTISGYYYLPSQELNYISAGDPCHPIIAVPERVKRLQSAWHNCIPNAHGGFYDPPKTLSEGSVLVPTTTATPPISTHQSAQPQVTPSPSQPLQTPGNPQPSSNPPTSASVRPSHDLQPSQSPSTSLNPRPTQNPQPSPSPRDSSGAQEPPTSDTSQIPQTSENAPASPSPQPTTSPQPPQSPPTSINSLNLVTSQTLPISSLSPPVNPGNSQPSANPPAGSQNPQPSPNNPANPPNPPNPQQSLNQPADPSPQNPASPNPPPRSSSSVTIAPPQGPPNVPQVSVPVITIGPGQSLIITPINPSANPNPTNPASGIVIGTQTLNPGQVITVGGQTSTQANGQITVVSGTPISLDPSGSQVVVGGTSTIALPTTTQAANSNQPFSVTVGSSTFTANSASQVVIGSQTLSPGSTVVVSGTTLSLAPSATQLVVNGLTMSIHLAPSVGPLSTPVTFGALTLIPTSSSQFVVGSQTVSVNGPAVTVAGTTLSLTTNRGGSTVLVAGTSGVSSTAAVVGATGTGSGGGKAPAASTTALFTGGAGSLGSRLGEGGLIIAIGGLLVGVLM